MEEPILKKPLSLADAQMMSLFRDQVIENTLNGRVLTETDMKVIARFVELISYHCDTKFLVTTLNDLYVKYTRLFCKLKPGDMEMFINEDTDNELYYLNEIIQVLKSE